MADTWILVADSARARLFSLDARAGDMAEIENFVNAAGRVPAHQRDHAPPPRTHDRFGEARHAIEPHTPPRDKSAARFAGVLKAALERGRAGQRFHDLVLIAPPRFLGLLKGTLDKELGDAVVHEVTKNLTRRGSQTIRAQIPRRLLVRGPLSPPLAAAARAGSIRLGNPR